MVGFYGYLKDKQGSQPKIEKMTPEQQRNVREHLMTGLRAEQKKLLNDYLDVYFGNIDPVPISGRDSELSGLDRWLDNPRSASYLLLTVPAGRGKTHLVVQWTARLIDQRGGNPRVILIPVSIRFNTAQPKSHLMMLSMALAQFYQIPIPENQVNIGNDWRGICADQCSFAEASGS